MGIKHAFTSAKSDGTDSSLLQPSNWNDDHDLTGFDILDIPTTESGTTLRLAPDGLGGVEWVVPGLLPLLIYSAAGYYDSGDPHNLTVTAPTTGSLVLVIQSDGRAATSVTQTNVTWTEKYTANSGSLYTSFWAGAITGSAGTNISADYASSTKANLSFLVFDGDELTTLEGSAVSTNGQLTLTGVPLGSLCIAAETAFNSSSGTYCICSSPHLVYSDGGCLFLTAFFYQGKTRISFIATSTRHDAVVSLS